MKTSSFLITAAVAGITMGLAACASAKPPQSKSPDGMAAEKHACKGQNACQGQGGCKTAQHSCAGQNACKGQGGCHG
ncbi:MAG TPA: hypothetical protein VNO21_07650 [Polyangiaceae bacterium]|nr:hypothetical protein [Polyangiaceae bacterium]